MCSCDSCWICLTCTSGKRYPECRKRSLAIHYFTEAMMMVTTATSTKVLVVNSAFMQEIKDGNPILANAMQHLHHVCSSNENISQISRQLTKVLNTLRDGTGSAIRVGRVLWVRRGKRIPIARFERDGTKHKGRTQRTLRCNHGTCRSSRRITIPWR